MVSSSGMPLTSFLPPRSSTDFWKYMPSLVTIISVCSSSLNAQIFLLCDGMLNFFTARSPSESRLKIRLKNLFLQNEEAGENELSDQCAIVF